MQIDKFWSDLAVIILLCAIAGCGAAVVVIWLLSPLSVNVECWYPSRLS